MKVHQLRGYIQNIFLVEYPHGCLLLDGACRADFQLIQDYFNTTLKRPISDLKIVMVTHMHPDHAGCAHLLRKKTGCKIICGSYKEQWYKGFSGRLAHLIDTALALWVATRLGRKQRYIWYPRFLTPDLMLFDGELIPEFQDWQVLTTPGHTSMDISLVNHTSKEIYVADLIVKVKGQLCSPYPVNFPKQYTESLARLKDLTNYTVHMAHVPSQSITNEELDRLISEAPSEPQNNRQVVAARLKKLIRERQQT